jgi:hypothetical protein
MWRLLDGGEMWRLLDEECVVMRLLDEECVVVKCGGC